MHYWIYNICAINHIFYGITAKHLYIFNLYMTTLAERDKLINHLQSLISSHKMFLGGSGVQLTAEERNKLGNLKEYLEGIGRGGEKGLKTVTSLLSQN
jgi:hypothetical protein